MRIWLVAISEPVPLAEGLADRPHRTGAFAEYASRQKHEVVWWTSTFDHFRKKQLFERDSVMQVNPNLQIRFLRGYGYRKNVSLARIADHRRISAKFAEQASLQPRPDVVLVELPPVELARKCTQYGRQAGVPVVVDMLDMWPDIFPNVFPRSVRWAARLALLPMFGLARAISADATAIIGMTDDFVEWGLRKSHRTRSRWDRAFPLTTNHPTCEPEALAGANQFWDHLGITGDVFTACFVGSLGRQFDIKTVIEGAQILYRRGVAARFVICGSGENLELYRAMSANLDNVVLPGWVNRAQMQSLLARCSVGIDPLPDRFDYLATINNKAVDYLSAGLPVLSSPRKGVLWEFLRSHGCGLSYEAHDSLALADTVTGLIRDPSLLSAMSARARCVFLREFEAEAVHELLLQYLQELAGEYNRGGLYPQLCCRSQQ
jgi:glycosyltransferase involved in cell wall biosynthesis